MNTIKQLVLGIAGFFFAAVAFANPNSRHHSHHSHHMGHYNRHLERDLAYIAGAALVGTIIYNTARPQVEYVPEQPAVIYNPPPQPARYYDMRWVYFPHCGCYRNVVVEVYR